MNINVSKKKLIKQKSNFDHHHHHPSIHYLEWPMIVDHSPMTLQSSIILMLIWSLLDDNVYVWWHDDSHWRSKWKWMVIDDQWRTCFNKKQQQQQQQQQKLTTMLPPPIIDRKKILVRSIHLKEFQFFFVIYF